MKNTSLRLSQARCTRLLELMEDTPPAKRDVVWNQLYSDIKSINDIWGQIDLRNEHAAKIKRYSSLKIGAKVKEKAK